MKLLSSLLSLCFAVGQAATVNAQEHIAWARNGEAKLRIFVDGSGPTLVLLPAHGRGPRDFDDLTRRFVATGYKVIRPEPRGFGESVGPLDGVKLRDNAFDVVAAIESVGAAPAIIAGFAYGNRVARMIATDRPELVRGLVLVAAGGKFPPPTEVLAGLRVIQDKALPNAKRVEMARRILFGPKCRIADVDMRLDEVSAATIKAQPLNSGGLDVWWDGGMAPMLIIQGLHDIVAIPENGRSLKRDHPSRVSLVELADVGHRLMLECPDVVVATVARWERNLPSALFHKQ